METETIPALTGRLHHTEITRHAFLKDTTIRKQKIISGFRKEIIEFLIRLEIVFLVFSNVKNPFRWYKTLKAMDPHRKYVLGDRRTRKIAKVDGKYYWGLYIPGWPSKTFHQFVKTEINRISPVPGKINRFTNIYVALTNKCPLACEHCYEWDALNKKEHLSLQELKSIIAKFQDKGTSQIHFTGGEPLVKVNDLIEVVVAADKETDFWVVTSGFKLTQENAVKLKRAGLKGVLISLDHFDPEMHNAFRGFKDAFQWVEKAVHHSIHSGLVTGLSICFTKSFVSETNLMLYMDLAKKMGVSFVQFLEPRAVGHYQGKDVYLKPEQEKILEEFYLKMNYDDAFRDYPLVCYHGYHQRRVGCLASGNRSLYVDTVGDLHACPFCQKKTGNALDADIDPCIEQLQTMGCHSFQTKDT